MSLPYVVDVSKSPPMTVAETVMRGKFDGVSAITLFGGKMVVHPNDFFDAEKADEIRVTFLSFMMDETIDEDTKLLAHGMLTDFVVVGGEFDKEIAEWDKDRNSCEAWADFFYESAKLMGKMGKTCNDENNEIKAAKHRAKMVLHSVMSVIAGWKDKAQMDAEFKSQLAEYQAALDKVDRENKDKIQALEAEHKRLLEEADKAAKKAAFEKRCVNEEKDKARSRRAPQ